MLSPLVRLFLFILIVTSLVQGQQTTAAAPPLALASTEAPPVPPGVARYSGPSAQKDPALRQAYNDVFEILSADNDCSGFYDGSLFATTVLNQLISQVRHDRLPDCVSFQMTGRPIDFRDLVSGRYFRLFEKVVVNPEGGFYRRRFSLLQRHPANIGSFEPGTRAARALILLHELGHLIRGHDGAWLLVDDGNDERQSKQNTAQVEVRCGTQLKRLN